MRVTERTSGGFKAMLAFMLLLAFAVKAIVPSGYMPIHGAKGMVVSLCTGEGFKQAILIIPQSDGSDTRKDKSKRPPQSCAFAVLAAAALGSFGPLLALLRDHLLVPISLLLEEAERLATSAYVRPPTRGPPIIV